MVEGDKERMEGGEWGNEEEGYGGRGEHGGREGMEGGGDIARRKQDQN